MSIIEIIKRSFETHDDSDISFIVHGDEIPAHSFFCISRSPVLKAMIQGPMAREDRKFPITDPDVTIDGFKAFLRFLYLDDVAVITPSRFKEFLHLSNFYDVQYLLVKCVEWFDNAIKTSNLEGTVPAKRRRHGGIMESRRMGEPIDTPVLNRPSILEFAEWSLPYADTCQLLSKCLKLISRSAQEHSYDPYDGSRRRLISSELATVIANCPRTSVATEEAIFRNLFKWAQKKCKGSTDNINTIRSAMANVTPFINFEKLELETVTTIVRDYKLLPNDQLIDVLCKVVQIQKKKEVSSKESPKAVKSKEPVRPRDMSLLARVLRS